MLTENTRIVYDLLIFTVVLTAALLFIRWRMRVATQKLTQRPLPTEAANLPQHPDGILLFFHHPRCGPCRQMDAQLTQLAANAPERVHQINVAENLELARAFGIRATPTTLLIKDNTVNAAFIGATSVQKIAELLKLDGSTQTSS